MLKLDKNELVVTRSRSGWKTWTERTTPNPSLGNLHRTFEWMLLHDTPTNYRVLGTFAACIAILCCLVAFFKYFTRTSTRWNVSPLAVALLLLHLMSDIKFETLAQNTSGATFWANVMSTIHLIHPVHGFRRYQGPVAYTLMVLGVWETLVFVLSPFILSQRHPRTRNTAEWLFYTVLMGFTFISVDTQIDMPLVERTHQYMSTRETYESMETFAKTVAALTVVFMVFTWLFALILDAFLFEGCMFDWFAGVDSMEMSRYTTQERAIVSTSTRTVSMAHQASEQPASHGVDAPTRSGDFLYKQMLAIMQQAQALEALTIDAERDDMFTYSKLGRSYAAILQLKPVLNELASFLSQKKQPADHIRRQVSAIEDALERIKQQMYNVTLEHNDISFVRSGPDEEVEGSISSLKQDAEGFIHVQLDRQEIREYLMETEDDTEILDSKLHKSQNSASLEGILIQLSDRIAAVRPHLDELLEKRVALSIPTPDESMEQVPEQGTPVRGLQLVESPPGETENVEELQLVEDPSSEADDEKEATSLPFPGWVNHGGVTTQPGYLTHPGIIDLTGPSPTPSPQPSPIPSPRKISSTPVRSPSNIRDENEEPQVGKPLLPPVKKSADHMVVGLWSSAYSLEFRSDNFLRGHGSPDLLKPDDLLAIGELGRYLTSKVRGNRAETAAASKILINLEKCARASKDNHTTLNVGVNNLNYFRSCMWLGQARLTKFPPTTKDRVFTEIPIEGIIKLAGYGPDGIKSLNMLPVPGETWAGYLQRLAAASDIKKIKELHEWLERYLGGLPKLLNREVPRAEGWDTGVPLDTNRCLYRHLENMMLLPPYPPEIEKALSIYRIEKADDLNFVGSALVEKVLDSPKANDMGNMLCFQPL